MQVLKELKGLLERINASLQMLTGMLHLPIGRRACGR